MNHIHTALAWLESLAFAALALGVLGFIFFWMPATGACLAAAGVVLGFFGWLAASQRGDTSSFYLAIGFCVSLASLVLNLLLVTDTLGRIV